MKYLLVSVAALFLVSNMHAQVTLTSSNLPIIVINTNGQEIPDDPKITADMGIINNGDGNRNNVTDAFNEYEGRIGIEIRGQSSQMFPMKSYSIELRDDEGESIDKPLFGLPEESDWVLYAPYNDKTLMRNFLAYTLSNELGHWAAHCRFAEVILNGNYAGIYVFMEKIKRNAGRVNIAKLKSSNTSGDAVTGGYIFSIDKEANGWFSDYHPNNDPNAVIQFSYVYPKEDDIAQEQKDYIENYVDSFENALHGTGFQDTTTGFRKFADEASFIDYFIVNEVSRNVDGYRLSSYFYKDRNSINNKIIAGPVWDYDLAFRNADYCDGSLTTGWAYNFNGVCSADYWQVPFWWNRFMQDTAFQSHLLCRWKEMRSTVLSVNSINHLIDSISNLVNEAQQRHFTQWPVLGEYVWPNPEPIPTSYAGEIAALKDWLAKRLQWLDENMLNVGTCATVTPPPVMPSKNSMQLVTANPVVYFTNAVIQSKEPQKIYVRMFNASGGVIMQTSIEATSGSNKLPFAATLNNLPHGIYFLQLLNDKGEKNITKLVH